MSAQDDLATLRLMFAHWTAKSDEDVFCPDARDVDAALSRVESRLARLEEGLRPFVEEFDREFRSASAKWHPPRSGVSIFITHRVADRARSLLSDQGGVATITVSPDPSLRAYFPEGRDAE